MTKNITNLILTIFLSIVFSLFLPWYSVMIAALISAYVAPLKKFLVFFIPFLAIFLYWGVYAYLLSSSNDFTLASKISELLKVGGNPYLLILITGVIGGLAGGFSGILGKQLVNLSKRD